MGIDANFVVCALAGGADCEDSAPSLGRRWPCPHLRHLILDDCSGIKSSCLRHALAVRRRHAEGPLPPSPERPVKPLRKLRTRSTSEDRLDSPPRSCTRPTKIRTLDIIRCYGLSETDVDVLKGPKFGLQELNWIDTPTY